MIRVLLFGRRLVKRDLALGGQDAPGERFLSAEGLLHILRLGSLGYHSFFASHESRPSVVFVEHSFILEHGVLGGLDITEHAVVDGPEKQNRRIPGSPADSS